MARRDIDEYFQIINEQYTDLLKELADLQSDKEIPEHIIEEVKNDIEVMKTNRSRFAYMMYLLDRPQRKEKAKLYEKCYSKRMEKLYGENSVDSVVEENEEILEKIHGRFH